MSCACCSAWLTPGALRRGLGYCCAARAAALPAPALCATAAALSKHSALEHKREPAAECVAKFEELPTFDDGPRFADSPGGGFDGNSASCRLLHSVLATFNTDHCAHLSFVPMADPFGKIKCQTSKRMRMTDFFDRTDLANFDTFKEAAGYDKGKGHKLVDRCFIYDSVRRPFPRPFWRTWRDDNPNAAMSPIEYISDEAWAWVMCCELPLAARGRWLLQIVVRQWFSDTFSDTCLVLRQP